MLQHIKCLLFLLMLSATAAGAQSYSSFPFQSGDFLFQDLDCGPLCDAIEKVTQGAEGRHFSHIGLVYDRGDSLFVIEAIGPDVHLTPIGSFLQRQLDDSGRPKITVGRLKPEYRKFNRPAIRFALTRLGVLYDDLFLYQNGKYYCSELIYDAYKEANGNQPFFKLYPMTFKEPGTGKTFPVWKEYYARLHHPIPEGKPGCNPGSISTSNRIDIITSFY